MLFLIILLNKTTRRAIRIPCVFLFSLFTKEFFFVWTKVALMPPNLFLVNKGIYYSSPTYPIPSGYLGYAIHQILKPEEVREVVTLLQEQYGLPLKEVTTHGELFYHEALSMVIGDYFRSIEGYSPSWRGVILFGAAILLSISMACVLSSFFIKPISPIFHKITPLNVEWRNVTAIKYHTEFSQINLASDLIAMRSVRTLEVALRIIAKENPQLAAKLTIYWDLCASSIFTEVL
jgi:hypothetical protein